MDEMMVTVVVLVMLVLIIGGIAIGCNAGYSNGQEDLMRSACSTSCEGRSSTMESYGGDPRVCVCADGTSLSFSPMKSWVPIVPETPVEEPATLMDYAPPEAPILPIPPIPFPDHRAPHSCLETPDAGVDAGIDSGVDAGRDGH